MTGKQGETKLITRPDVELYGVHAGYGYAGVGVSTAIGNFTDQTVDLVFPASLLGLLDWFKTYNSLSQAQGPLGVGWSTAFGAHLAGSEPGVIRPKEIITFYDEDGRILTFHPDGEGGFRRPQDLRADLEFSAGRFALTYASGEVWEFDAAGLLTARTLEGQRVVVERDTAHRVVRATHSTGRYLALSYGGRDRLTQVETDDGQIVAYGYDDAGQLTTATLPGDRTIRIETAPTGQISRIADPDGALVVATAYDPETRAVAAQDLPAGHVDFGYDQPSGVTVVTSRPGDTTMTYHAAADGRLVKVVDTAENAATFAYTDDGYLAEAVSPSGIRTTQNYDQRGNVLSSTTGDATSRWTYDPHDRVVTVTNPVGDTTRLAYSGDSHFATQMIGPDGAIVRSTVAGGLLLSQTDAVGSTTTYRYDGIGNPVAMIDPAGEVTQYSYDAAGRPTGRVDPTGAQASLSYDAAGNLIKLTDPTGTVSQFQYSAARRLQQIIDPAGASTVFEYDSTGNLSKQTDPLDRETTFSYDERGRLSTQTNPDGGIAKYGYDELDRLTEQVSPAGIVTRYDYDADGRQTAIHTASGTTRTVYDVHGNPTEITDPAGATTRRRYDAAGRLIATTGPDGAVSSYTYDQAGRIVSSTDPTAGVTRNRWTPAGQLAGKIDPLGRETSYQYDMAGRLIETTDPEGGITRSVYDADGRRIAVTSPAGLTTRFEYDAAGRQTATVNPRGWITRAEYDAAGQKIAVILPSGATDRYRYDAAGQLTEFIDANGGVSRYGYDNAGRLITVTNPKGAVTRYTYDHDSHQTSVTDPLNRTTHRGYDNAGNLIQITDPAGHAQHLQYDSDRRLIRHTADDGTEVTFGYDAAGRRISMTDATGTTRYAYDAAGRLTAVTDPDGAVTDARFDAAGQRTALNYPGGLAVSYDYDGNGRLIRMLDSRAGEAVYALDPDGRLLTEQLPTAMARRYHYRDGLLARFEVIERDHPVAATFLYYDPDGRILIQHTDEHQHEYRYDPAGQLVFVADRRIEPARQHHDQRETNADARRRQGSDVQLVYDAGGNRVRIRVNDTEIHYRYDDADQLIATETRGRHTEYRYDTSGRFIEEHNDDRRKLITYDGFGQPKEVTFVTPGRTLRANAGHNGDGLLVSLISTVTDEHREEQRAASVNYRWGSFNKLPQILSQRAEPHLDNTEDDRSGHLDADFSYGYGRTFASHDHFARTFRSDVFGSTVRTEDTEAWAQADRYDTFGRPEPPEPDQLPSPALPRFGYRGELALDPIIYLRARSYDAALGRFSTPDPVSTPPGQARHTYAYAANDPINILDPTGMILDPAPVFSQSAADQLGDAIGSLLSAKNTDVIPPGFPAGWGSPPTCPGSESCDAPEPKFNSKPDCITPTICIPFSGCHQIFPTTCSPDWEWFVHYQLQALIYTSSLLRNLPHAREFLQHFLNASGTPIVLSGSDLQSFYQIPLVKTHINDAASNIFNNSWNTLRVTGGVFGNPYNSNPWSAGFDWFFAIASFDYRIWSRRIDWLAGGLISFRFELSKYFDFDAPFLYFSTSDLRNLQTEGLGQDYWIVGLSDEITI